MNQKLTQLHIIHATINFDIRELYIELDYKGLHIPLYTLIFTYQLFWDSSYVSARLYFTYTMGAHMHTYTRQHNFFSTHLTPHLQLTLQGTQKSQALAQIRLEPNVPT